MGCLTFLSYSVSARLAGVSGCSLMRWPSQLSTAIEASFVYNGDPLFSFGVQFIVAFFVRDFLRPVYS